MTPWRTAGQDAARAKLGMLSTALQPHQQRVVDRIQRDEQPGLVVIHGLGTGKTLSSIAAADALGLPTTAVLPASLKGNYAKELEKHGPTNIPDLATTSLQKVTRDGGLAGPTGLMIVDEAHRVRDAASEGNKALRGVDAKKRLLLTASPTYNHPVDLSSLVNIAAGAHVLPTDKRTFEGKYVNHLTVNPGFVDRVFRGVKPGARSELKNTEELAAQLSKWVDYHANAPGGDFPTRIDEEVLVPLSSKQEDVYNTLLEKAPLHIRHKVRSGLPPSKSEAKDLNAFATGARQAQLSPHVYGDGQNIDTAHATKQREAFSRLQAAIAKNPEHRALVYSNYTGAGLAPYQKLLQEHKIPHALFTGDLKAADREQAVRDYNAGVIKALLVSSAGGEGLDLKGTRQIQILEPHFNDEKLKQVIGRGIRYKSHEHLPEDQRNVRVEQYLSTIPQGQIAKFFRRTPDMSADQYLQQLAKDKEALNTQLRGVLESAQAQHGG